MQDLWRAFLSLQISVSGVSQYQERQDCDLGRSRLASKPPKNKLGVQCMMGLSSFGEDATDTSLVFGARQGGHPRIFTVLGSYSIGSGRRWKMTWSRELILQVWYGQVHTLRNLHPLPVLTQAPPHSPVTNHN